MKNLYSHLAITGIALSEFAEGLPDAPPILERLRQSCTQVTQLMRDGAAARLLETECPRCS